MPIRHDLNMRSKSLPVNSCQHVDEICEVLSLLHSKKLPISLLKSGVSHLSFGLFSSLFVMIVIFQAN